jgi:hypothetical protein
MSVDFTGLGGVTQNVVALIATSVRTLNRTHYKAQAMFSISPIHFEQGDPKFCRSPQGYMKESSTGMKK